METQHSGLPYLTPSNQPPVPPLGPQISKTVLATLGVSVLVGVTVVGAVIYGKSRSSGDPHVAAENQGAPRILDRPAPNTTEAAEPDSTAVGTQTDDRAVLVFPTEKSTKGASSASLPPELQAVLSGTEGWAVYAVTYDDGRTGFRLERDATGITLDDAYLAWASKLANKKITKGYRSSDAAHILYDEGAVHVAVVLNQVGESIGELVRTY